MEDHPLLSLLLIKPGIRIPAPQQSTRRQDRLAPLRALVREPVGDALDRARRPDLERLAVLLIGPADLDALADELRVKLGPRRLHRLHAVGDALRLAAQPSRLGSHQQVAHIEDARRLEREHAGVRLAQRLGEADTQLRRHGRLGQLVVAARSQLRSAEAERRVRRAAAAVRAVR
eukprot:6016866-Prymnesium_polylepis.1